MAATGVILTDRLPSGVTFVSSSTTRGTCSGASTVTCSIGNLARGNKVTLTIQVKVDPSLSGPIVNTASVTSRVNDPNTTDNRIRAITIVNQAADLTLAKADSPDPMLLGDELTYTLTVTNRGPSTATGVTLTDTLPVGVTFVSAPAGCDEDRGTLICAIDSLAVGNRSTVTIVVLAGQPGVSPTPPV